MELKWDQEKVDQDLDLDHSVQTWLEQEWEAVDQDLDHTVVTVETTIVGKW